MPRPPDPDVLAAARHALQAGDLTQAAQLARVVLERTPDRVEALALLAQVELALGNAATARALLDAAIARAPNVAGLFANRAAVLLALDEVEAARADARQAAERQPTLFGAWLNLGLAEERRGEHAAAAAAFERALQLRADEPAALKGRARARYRAGAAHHAARRLIEAALKRDPADVELRLLLANSLLNDAEVDAARAHYALIERDHSAYPDAGSAALIARHYDPAQTPESLLQAHQAWALRHAAASPAPRVRQRARASRLRVGWLSPRFGDGPLASLVLPALEAMRALDVEHRLYASHPPSGSIGARFSALASAVVDVGSGSDATVVERLRSDELDVIVDLAGHAPGNRLRALSQRVAPHQVCWGDWFGTTGVPAIDTFLTDAFLSPPGSQAHFSEHLVQLARGRFPFAPALDTPSPRRRRRPGPPRLVSFNRVSKLNDAVLGLWGRVLARCPDATLQLRAGGFDDAEARSAFLGRAARSGLAPHRLELHGFASYSDVMHAYVDADVALDPFPFSGCATTADALWMGVPVVTLPGATLVSRQSGALLHHIGLDALIAPSADEYVERAAALLQQAVADRTGRDELRDRVREHLDPVRFAPGLRDALAGADPG